MSSDDSSDGSDDEPSAPKPSAPKPSASKPSTSTTFTREMDERILQGLVEDEAPMLAWMLERGHSAASIRARAAALGLTGQLAERCRLSGTLPSMRECLCCEQRILSLGPQHRLCRRCRQQS